MTSPSPAVLAAFDFWKRATLTCYLAQPCPGELMDQLTDKNSAALDMLALTPAQNANDVLLKLLPLALILNDAPFGQPPLLPVNEPDPGTDYEEDALWRSVIADLAAVCPILAEAIATPASQYAIDTAAEWAARPGDEA